MIEMLMPGVLPVSHLATLSHSLVDEFTVDVLG